jgi:hypothetical protein
METGCDGAKQKENKNIFLAPGLWLSLGEGLSAAGQERYMRKPGQRGEVAKHPSNGTEQKRGAGSGWTGSIGFTSNKWNE